jgi:microcystin-dependent protein
MSIPYVGELKLFAGNFAPQGWMLCEGQLLPIAEYETLFQLIGTYYGGDGQDTFALPDLRGRVPVHQGNGFVPAETGGVERVTLTPIEMPTHSHSLRASDAAATGSGPGNAVLAATGTVSSYGSATSQAMATGALTTVGGSQPHDNMAPYLAVNYIISLFGIFPSPT